ncbi:hypothetical protein SNEBB_002342 [Seison nebaliae]|nr:hypothetical protein SNEBB_002342 [Seison nebaliae]
MNQFSLFVTLVLVSKISSIQYMTKPIDVTISNAEAFEAKYMRCSELKNFTCDTKYSSTGDSFITINRTVGYEIGNEQASIYRCTFYFPTGFQIKLRGELLGKNMSNNIEFKGDPTASYREQGKLLVLAISGRMQGKKLEKLAKYLINFGNMTYCVTFCVPKRPRLKKEKSYKWLILIIIIALMILLLICGVTYYMAKTTLMQSRLTLA